MPTSTNADCSSSEGLIPIQKNSASPWARSSLNNCCVNSPLSLFIRVCLSSQPYGITNFANVSFSFSSWFQIAAACRPCWVPLTSIYPLRLKESSEPGSWDFESWSESSLWVMFGFRGTRFIEDYSGFLGINVLIRNRFKDIEWIKFLLEFAKIWILLQMLASWVPKLETILNIFVEDNPLKMKNLFTIDPIFQNSFAL